MAHHSHYQARELKGLPTAGRFAKMLCDSADLQLTDDHDDITDELLADLEPYGHIPPPRDGQTYTPDTGDTSGASVEAATFADAYVDYFRDAVAYARGGDTMRDELTEEQVHLLAGLDRVDLGRHQSTHVKRGDDGRPLVVVHSRNGGGNRQHLEYLQAQGVEAGPDCGCHGCIQTYRLPALPTYVKDEDDEGDETYANTCFRPKDEEAERRLEAHLDGQVYRGRLQHLRQIREGGAPPWSILTSVDDEPLRRVSDSLWEAEQRLNRARRSLDRFERLASAAQARDDLPEHDPFGPRVPGRYEYVGALGTWREEQDAIAKIEAEMAEYTVDPTLAAQLPPAVIGLLDDTKARMEEGLARARSRLEEAEIALAKASESITAARDERLRAVEKEQATMAQLEARIADIKWQMSWPGDPADCPVRPALGAA